MQATIELYISITKNLKPTPHKPHYQFNLRDISRVVEGMMLIEPNKQLINQDDMTVNYEKLVRLWTHEVSRTFFDRLINEAD